MHILQQIVNHKREEVALRMSANSSSKLEATIDLNRTKRSMSESITAEGSSGIIAEFKRRSPSRPTINLAADVVSVTKGYEAAGAAGLSVLTDEHFFGGSSQDLTTARATVGLPILRKDFIIDRYQLLEAAAMQADTVLLISEILTSSEVASLSQQANQLGLEVLLELHSESQLSKVTEHVQLLGVNNRDLDTFRTDVSFSERLIDQMPSHVVKVSESGIHDVETIKRLRALGYQGFLIGERFMTTDDPGLACKSFVQQVK